MRELEREFRDLNLSKLLLEGEYKAAIRNAEKKDNKLSSPIQTLSSISSIFF